MGKDRKRVRLQNQEELVRSVAEELVAASLQGGVSMSKLMAQPAVQQGSQEGTIARPI